MNRPIVRRASRLALLVVASGAFAVASVDTPAAAIGSTWVPTAAPPPEVVIETALASITRPASGWSASTPFADPRSDGAVLALTSRTPGTGWAHRLLPWTVVIAGAMRRPDDDPSFENERRETIYRAIVGAPGRYIAQLAAATGIPQSTVRYHVRVLADEGLIRTALIRGKRRCFPPEVHRKIIRVDAALDDDSTAPILKAVARLEPVSVSSLADAVDAAPSTVSYHLDRLADEELVDRERAGQRVVTRLEPTVRTYLGDADGQFGGDARME